MSPVGLNMIASVIALALIAASLGFWMVAMHALGAPDHTATLDRLGYEVPRGTSPRGYTACTAGDEVPATVRRPHPTEKQGHPGHPTANGQALTFPDARRCDAGRTRMN